MKSAQCSVRGRHCQLNINHGSDQLNCSTLSKYHNYILTRSWLAHKPSLSQVELWGPQEWQQADLQCRQSFVERSTPISWCMLCCSFSKQDSKSVWTWDPRISRVFLWHWWHWHCNWNCLHLQDRRQDILTEDSSSTTTGNVIVDRSLSKYVVRALPSIADISLSFCSAHLSKIIRN